MNSPEKQPDQSTKRERMANYLKTRRGKLLATIGGATLAAGAALGAVSAIDEGEKPARVEQVAPDTGDKRVAVKSPDSKDVPIKVTVTTAKPKPATTKAPTTETTLPPTTTETAPPTTAAPEVEPKGDLVERLGGRRLTPEVRQNQISSYVRLQTGDGSDICGANITDIDGGRYITFAAHCITNIDSGVDTSGSGMAKDVTGQLGQEYYISDAVSGQRLAKLDRVALGSNDFDFGVASTAEESAEYQARQARSINNQPQIGDEVAIYSNAPGYGGNSPGELTGVYLGEYAFSDDSGRSYNVSLVGAKEANTATIMGMGASGSSYQSAGHGELGPLIFSINEKTADYIRDWYILDMSRQTGIDLQAEGIQSVAELQSLSPADYSAFAQTIG